MYVGSDGGMIPGAGVFVAALERAVGRSAGYRHRQAVGHACCTKLPIASDSRPKDCLYIGDNPEADIVGAHAAGMDALLVLSGVASAADAEECPDPPEHVLPSVADLIGVT